MAVRACVVSLPAQSNTIRLGQWYGLSNVTTDTGEPFWFPDWADRCFHIGCVAADGVTASNFGTGGTVAIQGSNDFVAGSGNPGTWFTMNDSNGNAMSYTAGAIRMVGEAPLYVRPAMTAGTGTQSVNVALVARRLYQLF